MKRLITALVLPRRTHYYGLVFCFLLVQIAPFLLSSRYAESFGIINVGLTNVPVTLAVALLPFLAIGEVALVTIGVRAIKGRLLKRLQAKGPGVTDYLLALLCITVCTVYVLIYVGSWWFYNSTGNFLSASHLKLLRTIFDRSMHSVIGAGDWQLLFVGSVGSLGAGILLFLVLPPLKRARSFISASKDVVFPFVVLLFGVVLIRAIVAPQRFHTLKPTLVHLLAPQYSIGWGRVFFGSNKPTFRKRDMHLTPSEPLSVFA